MSLSFTFDSKYIMGTADKATLAHAIQEHTSQEEKVLSSVPSTEVVVLDGGSIPSTHAECHGTREIHTRQLQQRTCRLYCTEVLDGNGCL
jgi:hypothetical protein